MMTESVPELPFRTVAEALSALASGDITAVELTEAALRRIEAVNPTIGALREVFAERAHRDARLTDEARAAGRTLVRWPAFPLLLRRISTRRRGSAPQVWISGLDQELWSECVVDRNASRGWRGCSRHLGV